MDVAFLFLEERVLLLDQNRGDWIPVGLDKEEIAREKTEHIVTVNKHEAGVVKTVVQLLLLLLEGGGH